MAGGAQISGHYKQLIPPNFRWWKHPRLWKLMFWTCLYILGNCANGYDGALVSGMQILPYWLIDFNNPTGSTLGLLGAIQNIGSLGSIPVAPLWNDRFGRRKTVMLGTTMMITGAALQASAKNVNWFLGGRVLLGFGGGFNNNADPLMVIELCFPSHRHAIAGSYNSFTGIGSILAAALTFGTYYMASSWSWRLPALVQVLPSTIQFCLIMFGPESPRWLMLSGQEQKAWDTLVYYHGRGDPHDPLVLYEFEEMKESVRKEKENHRTQWKSLFNSKGMRRRSFIMMGLAVSGQWSGNSLVTYYLAQVLKTINITDRPSQLGLNLALTAFNFVCGFTAGFHSDRFGRRRILLVSTSLMLLFFVCVTICSAEFNISHSPVAGDFVLLFIFLFTGAYAMGWSSVMLLYITEISPMSMRSKAHSLWAITQASSQVLNQYTNPIALGTMGWKYYIVFDCLMVAILVFLYFCVVETRGLTLEETAMLFDGAEEVAELQRDADEHAAADRMALEHGQQNKGEESPDPEKGSIHYREDVNA